MAPCRPETGAVAHSHPNEAVDLHLGRERSERTIGRTRRSEGQGPAPWSMVPSNVVHSGQTRRRPEADVVFFTVKDASHGPARDEGGVARKEDDRHDGALPLDCLRHSPAWRCPPWRSPRRARASAQGLAVEGRWRANRSVSQPASFTDVLPSRRRPRHRSRSRFGNRSSVENRGGAGRHEFGHRRGRQEGGPRRLQPCWQNSSAHTIAPGGFYPNLTYDTGPRTLAGVASLGLTPAGNDHCGRPKAFRRRAKPSCRAAQGQAGDGHNFASAGVGTAQRISAQSSFIASAGNPRWSTIPFKGGPEAA